jgi:hypothetical protein
MPPLIDIGTDGQAILWRPHLLTDVMEGRRLDDLALEPVLNPAGTSNAALFKVESRETAVKWTWGSNWKRVEIRADQPNGLSAPLNYAQPQRPSVKWNELPASSAIELTFYGAGGAAGGCVRVEVPDTATFGREVEFGQPRGGSILVRLLSAKDSAGLFVELLRLGQLDQFRPKGVPIPFRAGEPRLGVTVPGDFFGIIAVVRNRHQRRSLIGYAHYDGQKTSLPNLSQPADVKEFQKVRRWVEGDARFGRQRLRQNATAEEWFDNWPSTSRRRLRWLADQARGRFNFTVEHAHKLLRDYPTGLLRYLALAHCGYESQSPEKIIRTLNDGGFQAALDAALTGLGGALSSLQSPEEKAWAVRRAGNPNLTGAVAWAGRQGVAALERALHLLDKRSEARASWEARRAAASS